MKNILRWLLVLPAAALRQKQQRMPRNLEDLVLSEKDLAGILGVEPKRIAYLRKEKGLSCIHITTRARVYLAEDVYAWIDKLSKV